MIVNIRGLTGRIGYRRGFFGSMVLRVEVSSPAGGPGDFVLKWRDATQDDVHELTNMRWTTGTEE